MLKKFAMIPLVLLVCGAAVAQDAPATAKVEKKPMAQSISAKGRIEEAAAETVTLEPYGYRGRFVVAEVVEAGTAVKAGDVVLRFDEESLTRAVDDARFELGLAEEEHRIRLARYRIGAADSAKELARRERDVMLAERRKNDWFSYDKPRADAYAELDKKQQEFNVRNAKEELRQLEMMYGEDELVDETEEIVLERSRHNLRRREALQALWMKNFVRNREVVQKRNEETLDRDLALKCYALEKAQKEAEHAAEGRLMGEMRANRSMQEKKRDFARLEALLVGAIVKAPADGILLHGARKGGLDRRFVKGSTVNVSEGIVSIADPSKLVAVLSVPAKEGLRIATGLNVELTPDVTGADAIGATIGSVSLLPTGGNYKIRCELPAGTNPMLMGAALKAKIVLEEEKEVLSVPSKCVLMAGALAFCRVEGKEGLTAVKVGRTDGQRTEILEGLAEGDEVLLPPEVKSK